MGSPRAISTAGKDERGRRRPSRLQGGKKHTRPVMQKHRFNVRLASRRSSGGRKKLVWTARKRETEIGRGGSGVIKTVPKDQFHSVIV